VNCRETFGVSDLPNGKAFYQYCVKKHTTTDLDPLEIHQIGLKEVERIQGEMQTILDTIQFPGTMDDYFTFLQETPEFYYSDPVSLIEGYKTITRHIESQLHLLFCHMPKLSLEILPIPEFAQVNQIGAYYMPGSMDTGRPGRFYANTYDLNSRPKWQMETLALHEGIPGHHFQISIAQEIEGIPAFRKYISYTAYIEGWGLYSESLGRELGLDKTPENQFGRLIDEIWRAVRLVVDTGIHAFGWSRDDAIAYMKQKTGISQREVMTEIDRYMVMPGQALAYKIGELSIKRWRKEAQEVLGDQFDIRAFHDMLLEKGALPLDVCEKFVYAWIEQMMASENKSQVACKKLEGLLIP
jgi:prolyl oligopeptidase